MMRQSQSFLRFTVPTLSVRSFSTSSPVTHYPPPTPSKQAVSRYASARLSDRYGKPTRDATLFSTDASHKSYIRPRRSKVFGLTSPSAQSSTENYSLPVASGLVRSKRIPLSTERLGEDYKLDREEEDSYAQEIPLRFGGKSKNDDSSSRKKKMKLLRVHATGGRKAAKAHVWIQQSSEIGACNFWVNGQRYVDYFSEWKHRWEVCLPFWETNTLGHFDLLAIVKGGGPTGQAGAIKYAVAKALHTLSRKKYRPALRKAFLLTRDNREVERKKYGHYKARKGYTYVRR